MSLFFPRIVLAAKFSESLFRTNFLSPFLFIYFFKLFLEHDNVSSSIGIVEVAVASSYNCIVVIVVVVVVIVVIIVVVVAVDIRGKEKVDSRSTLTYLSISVAF